MSGPTREQVIEWATSTGFTKRIQPGGAVDFNPYVYEFAALAYAAGQESVYPTSDDFEYADIQGWDIDGATAFNLIDRHADGWSGIGLMMEKWRDQAVAAEREACAKVAEGQVNATSGSKRHIAAAIRARGE